MNHAPTTGIRHINVDAVLEPCTALVGSQVHAPRNARSPGCPGLVMDDMDQRGSGEDGPRPQAMMRSQEQSKVRIMRRQPQHPLPPRPYQSRRDAQKPFPQRSGQIHFGGQLGVDLELFFVRPQRPLPKIGEWGWAYREFTCDLAAWEQWGEMGGQPAFRGHSCLPVHPSVPQGEERGRFVRVGQAARRPYLVAPFPRLPHEPMPRIRPWARRDGFELTAGERRDWMFLAGEERAFDDGDRGFTGRAGAIRHAGDARELVLLDGRLVRGQLPISGEESNVRRKIVGEIGNCPQFPPGVARRATPASG